jgi:thioredoxin 1
MSQVKLKAVTDASFATDVLGASEPVLVKFEADWCGPCKAMKPMIGEIADEFAGKLSVVTLDVDANAQTAYRYGIRGVPTVVLFQNGEPVAQKVGLPRKADLVALLNSKLPLAA